MTHHRPRGYSYEALHITITVKDRLEVPTRDKFATLKLFPVNPVEESVRLDIFQSAFQVTKALTEVFLQQTADKMLCDLRDNTRKIDAGANDALKKFSVTATPVERCLTDQRLVLKAPTQPRHV